MHVDENLSNSADVVLLLLFNHFDACLPGDCAAPGPTSLRHLLIRCLGVVGVAS
jgi:hypothetical protein